MGIVKPIASTHHHVHTATLMASHNNGANMTNKDRGKATKAIKAALWIRNKNEKREGKSEENTMQLARNHYHLFRLLSTDPSVDEAKIMANGAMAAEGIKFISDAMKHVWMDAYSICCIELIENAMEFSHNSSHFHLDQHGGKTEPRSLRRSG